MAVFHGLRGTPYDIPPEGTILFIEDVGERPYAIERMMYNLKLGGVLEKLSGLINRTIYRIQRRLFTEKGPLQHTGCLGEGV